MHNSNCLIQFSFKPINTSIQKSIHMDVLTHFATSVLQVKGHLSITFTIVSSNKLQFITPKNFHILFSLYVVPIPFNCVPMENFFIKRQKPHLHVLSFSSMINKSLRTTLEWLRKYLIKNNWRRRKFALVLRTCSPAERNLSLHYQEWNRSIELKDSRKQC